MQQDCWLYVIQVARQDKPADKSKEGSGGGGGTGKSSCGQVSLGFRHWVSFEVSLVPQQARYWDQKARDHTFHPDRHGGRRYSTLEWPDELALQWAVFYMWRTEPALTDVQVVDFLRQQGWTWRFWHLSGGDFEGICAWNLLRVCSSSVQDVYSPVT
eukprot:g12762.t1